MNKRYNFYLPVALKEDLDLIAKAQRRTTTEVVKMILEKGAASLKEKAKASEAIKVGLS